MINFNYIKFQKNIQTLNLIKKIEFMHPEISYQWKVFKFKLKT